MVIKIQNMLSLLY